MFNGSVATPSWYPFLNLCEFHFPGVYPEPVLADHIVFIGNNSNSAVFRSRRYAFPNKDEEMTETMLAQHTVDTIANLSSSKLPQPFFLAVGFVSLHETLSLSLSLSPVPPSSPAS